MLKVAYRLDLRFAEIAGRQDLLFNRVFRRLNGDVGLAI